MSQSDILSSKEFVFVVGSPRSGTTWVQTLIGSHPDVVTSVELTIFSDYVSQLVDTFEREKETSESKNWQAGLPYLFNREEYHEVVRQFIAECYKKVEATNPSATYILDKHPQYSYHVELIKTFIPQAKFIHVIRDGRDMALSYKAIKNNLAFFGSDNILVGAERWKSNIQAAKKAEAFGPADYMEVKYEDLLRDGVATLSSIFAFCGLSHTPEQVEKVVEDNSFDRMKKSQKAPDGTASFNKKHFNQGKANVWQEKMSAYDRYIFNYIAGPMLADYGYASNGWWKKSLNSLTGPIQFFFVRAKFRIKKSFKHLIGTK